jgi:hypothetical protein
MPAGWNTTGYDPIKMRPTSCSTTWGLKETSGSSIDTPLDLTIVTNTVSFASGNQLFVSFVSPKGQTEWLEGEER